MCPESRNRPARRSAEPRCTRRDVLLGATAVTAGATLLGFNESAQAAKKNDPRRLPAQAGDQLSFPSWEHDGRVLTTADVVLHAAPLLVYPRDPADGTIRERSRLNQILVMRFEATELDEKTAARAADGVVAYSGLCTHTACGVSEWNEENLNLLCPCHGSEFDPRSAARRVNGPAPRALPALPLAVDGEHFVIAGDFSGKLGASA